MPTMYDDVNALCPYFQSSGRKEICCEGITDGSFTNIKFRSGDKRDMHRRIFCDAKYKNCEVYRMLEQKYEE